MFRITSDYSFRLIHNVGDKNPAYKGATIISNCKTCGKEFKYFKGNKSGMYCSQECTTKCNDWRKKQSEAKIKSFQSSTDKQIKARIRSGKRYRRWCYDIYKRDGFKCTECGNKNNIEVHHIIPFSALYEEVKLSRFKNVSQLFDLDNGITLCSGCHKQTSSYRKGINGIPEKRLINAIKGNYQQDSKGFEDFDSFYKHKMNEVIEHFKSKLQ